MDKEHEHPIKKTKKKSYNDQITKQKKYQNETEEKFVLASKNEMTTKDNDNLDLPTYKNKNISPSNKLKSLINNQDIKLISSSIIKKQSKLHSTLIKRKNNLNKNSLINLLINRSSTDKSNEPSNHLHYY